MSKNIFDEILNRYKDELNKSTENTNVELELRFKNTDFNIFKSIYEYMLQITDPNKIKLSQVISSLMKQKVENQLQITNIKNTYYNNGTYFSKTYSSKIPISNINYNFNNIGLTYNVVLSLEKNDVKEFTLDESCIVRIKNRITFIIVEDNIQWKLDMTVVRQLSGNNIRTSAKNDVKIMFKDYDINPNNILTIFNDIKYNKYEIEIELVNNPLIKNNDILAIGNKILSIINPNYLKELTLQNKIYEIAKFIKPAHYIKNQNKLTLKQLLPKVKTLTRFEYKNIYPPIGMYITDKADGVRAIGIYDSNKSFIISNDLKIYENNKINNYKTTIVDGELINDILYIFDIIVFNGENISNLFFSERIKKLENAVDILTSTGMKCKVKKYIQFTKENIKDSIEEIYYKDRHYDIDGLIFVKPSNSYLYTETFKWKKIEDNTIDFLVKKVPESILNIEPYFVKENYTLYLLFVGINNKLYQSFRLQLCNKYNDIFVNQKNTNALYFPIQFSPSNAPTAYIYYHPNDSILEIDDNIVEFKCIGNCFIQNSNLVNWMPMRIREDRKIDLKNGSYYGNDYKIAETIWINYMDPFPLEQLWENTADEYFMSIKLGIYNAQTSTLSYFKNTLISSIKGYQWVIDIGSGKGQDLKRYFNAKIENFIAIDNDQPSLAELVRRKYIFAREVSSSTNVYVILADMKSDYNINIQKIHNLIQILPENKINAIVCNLSIHYYIYTEELLINFIYFVLKLLSKKGKLIITCFFGENVFNLLKDINEGDEWKVYDNNILKYSIQKLYSSKKIENMGQKIGVLLPFSNNIHYIEYLVNTTYLINMFEKYNLKLLLKKNISLEVINEFKQQNSIVGNKLSNDDINYLSLYGTLIFTNMT